MEEKKQKNVNRKSILQLFGNTASKMNSGTAEAWRRAPICGGHDLSSSLGPVIYGMSQEDRSRVTTANPVVHMERGAAVI